MKIFDKALLTLANDVAIKLGYNRAIEPEYLNATPSDSFWAVVFSMPHEHKAGQPTDPHVRCMLRSLETVPGTNDRWRINDTAPTLFVDTVPEIFDRVPDLQTVPVEAGAA